MRILINNYLIECFDDLLNYKTTLKGLRNSTVFSGELYEINKKINDLVGVDVIVQIKSKIFHDVKYVIITKNENVLQKPEPKKTVDKPVVDEKPVDEKPVDEKPVFGEPVEEFFTNVNIESIDEEPMGTISSDEEPVDEKKDQHYIDLNIVSLDKKVEYLKERFKYSSTADAKCIYDLIEFYEKHK